MIGNGNVDLTDEEYNDLMCKSNPDCLAARKFAVYEMVMGEDYFSSEREGKEQILAGIIYLIEQKMPSFLGGYDITIEEDIDFTLAGLHEDVEGFTNWSSISDVKRFLEKDKRLGCIISELVCFCFFGSNIIDPKEFFKDMALALYDHEVNGRKASQDLDQYKRYVFSRACKFSKKHYKEGK